MTSAGRHTETDARIRDIAAHIAAHADEPLTLGSLAARAGLSPSYLQRSFTRAYGMSPKRYQTALRVESMKAKLRDGAPVSDAVYAAGFGSSRGAYEAARQRLGMPPGTYAKRGAGLEVRYTVAPSPIGLVLVGETDLGVCAVLLGDDGGSLVAGLEAEFGAATLVRDDAAVRGEAEAVVAYIAGRSAMPHLPLDLHGTEFQRQVWTALTAIPAGTTVTYSELARAIGRPTAQRAVASACGDNHVSVLVPCHRVVRKDGGLGGYKWGVDRKRRLLEREGAAR
jgi:AraC family transcriptional regulator, regulatory protein of adaptative response / methylated-DNA-[protein]-cysteine methyltransferase